jgi:hypothetical protein
MSRRRFLATGAAAGGAAVAATMPGWLRATAEATGSDASAYFEAYENAAKPRFRYWWPGAYAEPAQVAREVGAMAEAGFGGFEIADVRNTEPGPLPPEIYGWGSPRWKAAVVAALRAAADRGLEADLTIGPYWPAVSPRVEPDDEGAAKELTWGKAIVNGGAAFSGAIPPPHAAPSGSTHGPAVTVTPQLLAVHAARIVGAPDAAPLVLERGSLVDLTARVSRGGLGWTVPTGGTWVIIASYSRGTAMVERQPYYEGDRDAFTAPQAYVVDHFGEAGTRAITDWWEQDLLTPEMRKLLRQTGGQFFEDSLEFITEKHFTPRLLAEFESRRGYSLVPYLPLALQTVQRNALGLVTKSGPVFDLDDPSVAPRVLWDYDQTLSDLFIAHHVRGLQGWAQRLGMRFRNQSYGAPIDTALASAQTGTPEGESLAFGATPDAFRLIAAGRDAGRRKVLSNELGAQTNGAYRLSWADLLSTAHLDYGLGVNQSYLHGFPYLASPTNRWPGFYPWAPPSGLPITFAEAWGPRQPQWAFAPEVAAYMSRVQQVLQSGTNKVDVAVYHGALDDHPATLDGALTAAGYSYGLVSPGILDLPTATVRRGRLDADGAAYKALVVNAAPSMAIETARTLLRFAQAGLPIVIVGPLPSRTPGNRDAPRSDAVLAATFAQLVASPRTTRVSSMADVPAAVRAGGAVGSAITSGGPGLLHVQRVDGSITYHYLHNPGSSVFAGSASLEGDGTPLLLDAWTGSARRLAVYDDHTRGRIGVPLRLAAHESTIIVLAGGRRQDAHAVSSDGDVRYGERGLVARATASGTVTAVLDDGRKLRAQVTSVPSSPVIGGWQLTVTSWTAADPNAVGGAAPATKKTTSKLALAALAPWSQIPGLEDASGVGVYTTTITLPRSAGDRASAYLDLGSVGAGSVGVKVNGRSAGPVDQITRVIDLHGLLRAGANTIEVTVTTTLFNAVRAMRPANFSQPRQDYGLIGPVIITPYDEAPLSH